MPRRLVLGAAIAIAVIVVGMAVFGTEGLKQYRRLNAEAAALTEQNQALVEENRRLTEEVKRLKSDPAYLEKVARDQLGHVSPGETVYLVPDPDTPAQ